MLACKDSYVVGRVVDQKIDRDYGNMVTVLLKNGTMQTEPEKHWHYIQLEDMSHVHPERLFHLAQIRESLQQRRREATRAKNAEDVMSTTDQLQGLDQTLNTLGLKLPEQKR